ncbi:hypothetical protein [Flagellimonas sp.]|uniref:hypothetical protein n=1 Tax=Flagellimonas sp. TaxID=2058762 RepID=UPI003BA9A391
MEWQGNGINSAPRNGFMPSLVRENYASLTFGNIEKKIVKEKSFLDNHIITGPVSKPKKEVPPFVHRQPLDKRRYIYGHFPKGNLTRLILNAWGKHNIGLSKTA